LVKSLSISVPSLATEEYANLVALLPSSRMILSGGKTRRASVAPRSMKAMNAM
jgi:hypothetical protein